MSVIDAYTYSVAVRKIEEDGETLFEARIKELPDVCEFAETYDEAYELAIDTIETAAEMYAEEGREFPLPHREIENYSGRVTLRMEKSLHRSIALVSEYENVSLNSLICNVLSRYTGLVAGANLVRYENACFTFTARSRTRVSEISAEEVTFNPGNSITSWIPRPFSHA